MTTTGTRLWRARAVLFAAMAAMVVAGGASSAPKTATITLMATTSTENSGLLKYLLPKFEAAHGIKVRVVAHGTGQALRAAGRGDADVVLVHDRKAEMAFIAKGLVTGRRHVMFNDFVIIGPKGDPARIKGAKGAADALQRIRAAKATFVSRGDDSGAHKAELRLWRAGGQAPPDRRNRWYREVGSGMGAALNIAANMGAYILSDRGTWLSFNNRRKLGLLFEGNPPLLNQYSIMLVNPKRHPHIKETEGRVFINWLTSPSGQGAIAAFNIKGKVLFTPNYQAKP